MTNLHSAIRPPSRSGTAAYSQNEPLLGYATTSDATRSHRDHRGLRCGMSSSQYRYQLRRSHSVLLLRTLRAPRLGAPGQLIAGGAGARPDHSISGLKAGARIIIVLTHRPMLVRPDCLMIRKRATTLAHHQRTQRVPGSWSNETARALRASAIPE